MLVPFVPDVLITDATAEGFFVAVGELAKADAEHQRPKW